MRGSDILLYIIRHGQTDWNYKKLTMGRKDIPLNEEGIRQANVTKELIDNYDIDLIICSPLERAKQTANIVNKDRNVDIIFDERIIERGLGQLEGAHYTSDNDRIWDININTNDYEIETMLEFKERVYSFIDEIINKYQDKNILLVTHGGVTALINCYFNDSLYDGPISNKFLSNCSITSYDIKVHCLKKVKN